MIELWTGISEVYGLAVSNTFFEEKNVKYGEGVCLSGKHVISKNMQDTPIDSGVSNLIGSIED